MIKYLENWSLTTSNCWELRTLLDDVSNPESVVITLNSIIGDKVYRSMLHKNQFPSTSYHLGNCTLFWVSRDMLNDNLSETSVRTTKYPTAILLNTTNRMLIFIVHNLWYYICLAQVCCEHCAHKIFSRIDMAEKCSNLWHFCVQGICLQNSSIGPLCHKWWNSSQANDDDDDDADDAIHYVWNTV